MGSYLLHLPPLIGAQLKEEARAWELGNSRAFFGFGYFMVYVLPTSKLNEGKELGLKEFRAKKVKEKIFCGILINAKKT